MNAMIGGVRLCGDCAKGLMDHAGGRLIYVRKKRPTDIEMLLKMKADGKTNREIGDKLGITPRHVSRLSGGNQNTPNSGNKSARRK